MISRFVFDFSSLSLIFRLAGLFLSNFCVKIAFFFKSELPGVSILAIDLCESIGQKLNGNYRDQELGPLLLSFNLSSNQSRVVGFGS